MKNLELCQIVLQTAYGGPLRTDEQSVTPQLVLRWLYQRKNEIMAHEMKANQQYVPPYGLYSNYEVTATWDSRRGRWRFKLPKGNPPQITSDRGIKLEGLDGSLIYKRLPRGFCEAHRHLAFLEGNIGWEFTGDGHVEIANLPNSTVAPQARLMVIETASPGLNDECTIPGEWHSMCMEYALKMMGVVSQDPAQDNVDQALQGGGNR